MRRLLLLSTTALFALAAGPDRRGTAEDLYASLGGLWRPADEKAPLECFWLHRNEKGVEDGPNSSPWRVRLAFNPRGPDDYSGPAARVEADNGGLTVTLPAATAGGRPLVLRIAKKGDKVLVRVTGGRFAGTYEVRRGPAKQ